MTRPALVLGSILLFGCGTPYQLLIHNDLAQDEEITVRWTQEGRSKPWTQDRTVFVPQGRAEEAYVWYTPPDDRGIDFLWNDDRGSHRIHVRNEDLPLGTYHAYVKSDRIRFTPRDWMDSVHLNLTSYMAPCWWTCILVTAAFPLVALRKAWKRKSEGLL